MFTGFYVAFESFESFFRGHPWTNSWTSLGRGCYPETKSATPGVPEHRGGGPSARQGSNQPEASRSKSERSNKIKSSSMPQHELACFGWFGALWGKDWKITKRNLASGWFFPWIQARLMRRWCSQCFPQTPTPTPLGWQRDSIYVDMSYSQNLG